jgi:hypothetical protein
MFEAGSEGTEMVEVSPAAVAALAVPLRAMVSALDPEAVPLPDAPDLWREFDRLARLASGAALLLTRRVEESTAWSRAGARTSADWMAGQSGGSVGDARAQLRAAEQLKKATAAEEALKAGRLSKDQAEAIADAAAANPAAEADLLGGAEDSPLRDLQERCRRAKAAADRDPAERERRIHANRRARWWTSSDGVFHFKAEGTVASGVRLTEALQPLIDQILGEHRTAGQRRSRDAYAYDALMRLVDQATTAGGTTTPDATEPTATASKGGKAPKVRHRAIIRIDHAALVRGRVEGDELCEITGLGPIPIRTALALLGESTLHLVMTKGVDVANVTYLGRGPNAAQLVALQWAQPMCSNRACTGRWLQTDHRDDYAADPITELPNLDRLCPHCHRLKTYKGWMLVAGTGRRDFVPPGHPNHPTTRAGPGNTS